MDIGVIKNWSVLYFGETSMCLCRIVSVNIRYVKNVLKIHNKTKGKTKENVLLRECFILLDLT